MLCVTLIEDNDAHAELFSLHLSQIEGLAFDVSHCKTGSEAMHQVSERPPDLLFVDYKLSGETGADVISKLRSRGMDMPIVAITSHNDGYIGAEVTRAGADDYLDKRDLGTDQLVGLLDRMLAVGRARGEQNDAAREYARRLSLLTKREAEVLDHIMSGQTNKQIAADLHRSIKTIKVHRGRIMEKMGAQTPAELAKFVLAGRAWRS